MNFQFTNPGWLWLLPLVLIWIVWLGRRSDVQISLWRRWTAMGLRMVIATAVVFAIAGLQWLRPMEGMNAYFLLDQSESIPFEQQEAAREWVNRLSANKETADRGGLVVFGTDAAIEFEPNPRVDVKVIQAVVETDRTDIASAIRLGTAAFPEVGQKKLVLFSDGHENIGDAVSAVLAARPLGVTLDVVPLGVARANDVSVQRLSLPNNLKKGQTFEVKIFAESEVAQPATIRLYRNDQYLGDQQVELAAGKNLFTFPQTLSDPGFYNYDVIIEAEHDQIPQNNRASGFTSVRGDPKVLIVSSDPDGDRHLAEALTLSEIEVELRDVGGMPGTLAEMQSFDSIFLSNVAAGDLGRDMMRLLESAVRDFGVGLVCVGGDQTYAAGGYRQTPLERALPVDMELSSKKVLPRGALVLVMHGMEFNNGNQISREIAIGALDALGPDDEIGVLLWDGREQWLFPLTRANDKRALGRKIAGMNQGDLPSFQGLMEMAHQGLRASTANLKHVVVFSDGDPGAPTRELLDAMAADRITISSILIAGHGGPKTMMFMADVGRGRFYDVRSPSDLPQVFIKEAAVILKSAIFEEPFKPRFVASSELVRGIGADEYPDLLGYVATTPKPRAEIPLVSDKGDPVLAHWQYGLGRAVAFTSDAKPRWAQHWLGWEKYRQFWAQIAQWSLRRVESSDFTSEVVIDRGEGHLTVEALDGQGNFRNFLDLQAVVVSPRGERQTARLEQTGPGYYELKFPTREVGGYLVHLIEMQDGEPRGSMVLGASINYSPEFNATEPNMPFLQRLAELGGGKVIDPRQPAENPFLRDRQKTFQPRDLWEWLLKFAILLFPVDVGIRRIQLDRAEWLKATATLRRWLFFWWRPSAPPQPEESLASLLSRRNQVRSKQTAPAEPDPDLFRPQAPAETAEPGERPKPGQPVVAEKKEEAPQPAESTTSRLLEAKRRAQRR